MKIVRLGRQHTIANNIVDQTDNNYCEWDPMLVRNKNEKDEIGGPRTSDGAEESPDFGKISN
jgi:hypothetical protein